MILSRASLAVESVASRDPFDRGLNGVSVEADGSAIAGNGRVLLAVGPVGEDAKRAYPNVGERIELSEDERVLLKVDHVQEARKNMPKEGGRGARAVLGHVALVKGDVAGEVSLACKTAEGRTRKTADMPLRHQFPDWRKVVAAVAKGGNVRVCVNRKDLLELLKAMEEACPDKGNDCPVYMEIGSGIVLRSVNRETRQRAVGAISAYQLGNGAWLGPDSWEGHTAPTAQERKALRRKGH